MSSQPKFGDTRRAPCSWCKRPELVLQTFRPYDESLPGGYWDTGECPCGDIVVPDFGGMPMLRGLQRYGGIIVQDHKDNAHNPRRYHKGVLRDTSAI